MKTYRVYADDEMFDAVVSDNNDDDEFLDMASYNGWATEEISK